MIVLDSSGLYSALDGAQPGHPAARRVLESERGPLILSPFVLCEVDYLTLRNAGVDDELALLDQVAAGAFELAATSTQEIADARAIAARYADLRIGLADASIVVLAGRYGTNRVLTFDERHFRALRTPDGDPFVVLPADA